MKILRTDYTFNPIRKTITFFDSVYIERILLITNINDNTIIYVFNDPLKGGTVAGNDLILTYDTSSMSSGDRLQIFYEDFTGAATSTNQQSTVSTLNSSSTALGIGGIFSGAWVDIIDYAEIIVSVFSDKASATNGLLVEWSSDASLVCGNDVYIIPANAGKTYSFPRQNRYVRITYTNGAVAQTTFCLETILSRYASKGSSHRIKDSIVNEDDAILVKAVLTGLDTAGNFVNITASNDNQLLVTSAPYVYAIAEGYITGHTIKHKMGYTLASAATETTLWNPGTQYVFPAGALTVEIFCANANDTALGSGATQIEVPYLDTSYNEHTAVFDTNGGTQTLAIIDGVGVPQTVTNFFRVNGFHVIAGNKTAGVIDLRLTGGAATIYSQLPAGATRARNSVFTVPLGKTYFVENVHFSAGYKTAGKTVRMTLHASVNPYDVVSTSGLLFWPHFESMLLDNSTYDPSEAPLKFPAKTDIKVSVIGETLAQCTSRISGWIETS
jgi:hypothetical protein